MAAESRRTALKRLFIVLGGVVGAGAAGGALSGVGRKSTDSNFTLEGRDWHIYSKDLAKGDLPSGGDRMLSYGELYEPNGEKSGEFFATYFSLHRPGVFGPLTSMEQHTFNLKDGSITGSGTTRAGLESDDHFAITGGTGRYSGARGSYTVRQSHQEMGGDGTASFTFTLITEANT